MSFGNRDFCDSKEGFNPDEISWITERIGVTNLNGSRVAADLGHYVINTAEEIESQRDSKIVINYRLGPKNVEMSLDQIANLIQEQLLTSKKKIVVHCFWGMERSVLAVVWYLHIKLGLSIDQAYERVRLIRPIAIDHRSWVLA